MSIISLFANIIHQFYYLRLALAVILSFVGVKMVLTDLYHIPTPLSLIVIAVVLAIAIIASLLRARRASIREDQQEQMSAPPGEQTGKAQDHPAHKE